MSYTSILAGSSVIPCLRYRDALSAIGWLCDAFGFTRQMVVAEKDGTVAHAQLRLGNGMIMVSSVRDTPFGKHMVQPDEVGGCETQSSYVVVRDADDMYAAAKRAGAEIVIDIHDEEHGGRGFGCRDLEGHLWYFGTYDPWQEAEP